MQPKTLLITGASSGIGSSLAEQALERGWNVAMAVRKPETVSKLVTRFPEKSIAIRFDLTQPSDAIRAIRETCDRFKSFDVLINNAGSGLLAAFEGTSDEQLQKNLETNFLGPFRLTRAAIPVFRTQQEGHIITLSAIAAYANHPGFAVYGGAKAAMDAASDALAQEVKPFGIRVTLVIPGPYRTNFSARSLENDSHFAEYEGSVGKFAAYLKKMHGKQPGDPTKAAKAILDILMVENPPFRLVLGNYSNKTLAQRISSFESEMKAWHDVGFPTDFISAS